MPGFQNRNTDASSYVSKTIEYSLNWEPVPLGRHYINKSCT